LKATNPPPPPAVTQQLCPILTAANWVAKAKTHTPVIGSKASEAIGCQGQQCGFFVRIGNGGACGIALVAPAVGSVGDGLAGVIAQAAGLNLRHPSEAPNAASAPVPGGQTSFDLGGNS
jgi:hypothetical protein